MGVDEAGHDVTAGGVEHLTAVVLPEPGHEPVAEGDVGVQPLAGEDGEHAAAADDEVGRLAAPRDGDAPCEKGCHSPTMSSGRTGTRVSGRPVAARSAATIAAV